MDRFLIERLFYTKQRLPVQVAFRISMCPLSFNAAFPSKMSILFSQQVVHIGQEVVAIAPVAKRI